MKTERKMRIIDSDEVKILSGKFRGQMGRFCCWTDGDPKSSFSYRAQVRVFDREFQGWRTVLLSPHNIVTAEELREDATGA